MTKKSILAVILLVLAALPAFAAEETVRIRSDGKIIDGSGKVIAVPAQKDSRNNEYNRYYTSLDANGKPLSQSDFYIYADPLKGYVKKPLKEEDEDEDANVATPAAEPMPQPEQNGMVRKYNGSQYLRQNPNIPVYDNTETRTMY